MKFKIVHVNFHVIDLEKSIKFYFDALGLTEFKRSEHPSGEYKIVFLKGEGDFFLELTWNRDKIGKYDLGENQTHLAFRVDDYQASYDLHKNMGCISYDNVQRGLYFICDPDEHWLEILPPIR
ncbi:MAG: VOC family protein [Clostridiales bacterium]|jgi:lactoylglutathione lyase|nr:VOC family protein [Clostridiales bacterium]